jgi:hypothetical protein
MQWYGLDERRYLQAVARLLIVCGSANAGCADDAAEPTDVTVFAGEAEAWAQSPQQDDPDLHIQPPNGSRIVKMKFLNFVGDGCQGAQVTSGARAYADFMELRFDQDQFEARTHPDKGQREASDECHMAILVRGARGLQVVTQQFDFSGAFILPADGSGTVTSEIRWKEGAFGEQEGSRATQQFFGPREEAWVFSHSTRAWPAASSKCFATPCDESDLSRCDEDVLYLNLKVQVEAPHDQAWMSLLYGLGSTFTKAAVQVQLDTHDCTPSTAP